MPHSASRSQMRQREQDELNLLIGSLYDTVLNPHAWRLVGECLRSRFHSVYAGLYVFDTRSGALVHEGTAGTDEEFVAQYANEFCFIDPYRESEFVLASNPGLPLTDPLFQRTLFDVERSHAKHPFFGDYWNRYDVHHTIAGVVNLANHLRAGMSAPRSASIGAYSGAEIREFQVLREHFHRAMRISSKLEQLGLKAAALDHAIGAIGKPTFIVDGSSHILLSNQAAFALLNSRRFIQERGGLLTSSDSAFTRELRSAISRAANEEISQAASLSRLVAHGPIEVLVSPMQRHADELWLSQGRAAVIVLEGVLSTPRSLAELYRLSPAQAAVLDELVNGRTIPEIAGGRGTSPETVRSQVKAIHMKVGTSSIKELAALLARPADLGFAHR